MCIHYEPYGCDQTLGTVFSLNSAASSFFYFDSNCSLCCVLFSVFSSFCICPCLYSTLVVNKRAYYYIPQSYGAPTTWFFSDYANEGRQCCHVSRRSYKFFNAGIGDTRSRNLYKKLIHRCTWPKLCGLIGRLRKKVSGTRNFHRIKQYNTIQ